MRFEADEISLVGGIRHGRTLGSPVAIEIANTEWPKWTEEMSPEPGAPSKVLTQPRPGHADLPGMLKYGFEDARDVLERASARETAARVAAGTLAKLLLTPPRGLASSATSSPWARPPPPPGSARPGAGDLGKVDASAVRCFDAAGEEAMVAAVKAAAKVGDSLGGVAEVLAYGVPGRPRQPCALGPQARRQPRPGAHVDPGGQGGRDRGRLGQRRPPGFRRARRHPLRRDEGLCPAHGPGGRDRGRHLQWRAARRPRGDEAARHLEPARARDGRCRHQGIDRQLP